MLVPQETAIIDVLGDRVFYTLSHQVRIVEALNKNSARQFQLKREVRERSMDFTEAIEKAKSGGKVRRPSWDGDMFMWWAHNLCFHSHPYEVTQEESPFEKGYYYIIEKDDASAIDWELIRK